MAEGGAHGEDPSTSPTVSGLRGHHQEMEKLSQTGEIAELTGSTECALRRNHQLKVNP